MKRAAKKTYTITEAARRFRVTRATIHQAIKDKRLTARWGAVDHVVKTRALLIPAESLRKFKIDKAQQKRGKKKP
jgi:hypothetical protein